MSADRERERWYRGFCAKGQGWVGSPTKDQGRAQGDCDRHESSVTSHQGWTSVRIYEVDDARDDAAACEHAVG